MTTTAPLPARVPQPQRAAAMRGRLLEATVEVLVERGWSGTTTTVVSTRAGVSRGAQLHHFPSKRELVVAAVDHLGERLHHQLQQLRIEAPTGQGSTVAALTTLADFFVSDLFVAALELWVAARTDPELLESVAPMERRWGRRAHRLAVELLGVDDEDPQTRLLIQGLLDMLRGLGLANTLSDDGPRRAVILQRWAPLIDQHARRKARS
ncbi:TetR/AcrR family transcriptional regulator [Dermatophilaceae bacterium Sec6.4]